MREREALKVDANLLQRKKEELEAQLLAFWEVRVDTRAGVSRHAPGMFHVPFCRAIVEAVSHGRCATYP